MMKFTIYGLMLIALIGCNSTTYECVEVYGTVGVIQDGCLVEPLADVKVEFNPLRDIEDIKANLKSTPCRMIDGKYVFLGIRTTESDSLGHWIISLNPGEYIVYFEKFKDNKSFSPRRIYYNSHLITVPDQPKWRFTID